MNSETSNESSAVISWAVPKELEISPDPLRLRIDFHTQATTMTFFEDNKAETRMVDAMDIAHALAKELSFGTGLLPPGCLWWNNTRQGPLFAIYTNPQIRKLALQVSLNKPAKRYTVPMPGLIFLCRPGMSPWVFAVGKKPTKETNVIYHAPLTNVDRKGKSCAGSHKYPDRAADMVPSFFESFFTVESTIRGRSKKYPESVIQMWEELDGKPGPYPISDLVKYCTLADLMNIS